MSWLRSLTFGCIRSVKITICIRFVSVYSGFFFLFISFRHHFPSIDFTTIESIFGRFLQGTQCFHWMFERNAWKVFHINLEISATKLKTFIPTDVCISVNLGTCLLGMAAFSNSFLQFFFLLDAGCLWKIELKLYM